MRRIALLLAMTAGGALPLPAQEESPVAFEVHEHTLENGLRLLVLPRPGAPIVSFVVQYRVGSVDEPEGRTGMAHLLEHLLFKGTGSIGTRDLDSELRLFDAMDRLQDSILSLEPSVPPGTLQSLREEIRSLEEEAGELVVRNEYDAILTEHGARSLNATTTEEATTYFVELPANRAELWFALEGDRMADPVFREFYAERDVVAEERRLRLETNPSGLLYEAHLAEAFRVHPYGRPVIGSMEDLEGLTRTDVESFHGRYYTPGNAVVVVVGNVDPERILEWARRYLGPLGAGPPPPILDVREPEQSQERRVELELDAEPVLRMGWRVPAADHPDAPALAMLASILTGTRSARLHRRLILEDRIATGVTAGTGPGRLYPGLFSIDAFPRSPHTAAEVEAAVYQELEALKESPPEEKELQRIRNQLEAADVRRFRSNLGLALQLAESMTLRGEWDASFRFLDRIGEVTPEDIQRVVREYFRPEARTVATLVKSPDQGTGGE